MSSFYRVSCIVIIIIFLLMIVVNVIIHNSEKSFQRTMYLFDGSTAFSILESLDRNYTAPAKSQFIGDIKKVFYMAGKTDDLNIFLSTCENFTEKNMQLYKKYEHTYPTSDQSDFNDIVNSGKKKLLEFCKTK